MYDTPLELSPAAQDILRELTRYHADRLYSYEQGQRKVKAARDRVSPWSLSVALEMMSAGSLKGAERENLEEYSRVAGVPFDPQRVYLPFSALRDLSAGKAAAGGYLISTDAPPAADILRPWSVTARAGMQVEFGLVGNQQRPRVTTKSTAHWVSTETTEVQTSQPVLQAVALTPKTVGAVIPINRQLRLQSNVDQVVGRELLRTVGTGADQGVINGDGAAGVPLGLLNTPGIQTQSGTTLNAGVLTMKKLAAEANVTDENIKFLSTPAVRELLEGREVNTGGGRTVWQDDKVANRQAFVSTDVPAATMICGDFSHLYLGIWGNGITVEINPYDVQGFKTGVIYARVLVSCDVAVLQPGAFVVARNIT